uniref:Uncharacterized protein n=1 Tax=Curvibacter symbiont subsp. Hydra magnipapillata TaxID=667019 RepID=C9Y888_CURXX|nr:hypothetical protein Csp_A03390 [Curvibacter putative symbiont of Hydra magnipapillata]
MAINASLSRKPTMGFVISAVLLLIDLIWWRDSGSQVSAKDTHSNRA